MYKYTLTDTDKKIVRGTGYNNIAIARNHAVLAQEYGGCKTYSIGCFMNGSFLEVYNSSDNYEHLQSSQ